MARYDEQKVPRGASRRWEVIVSDDGRDPPVPSPRSALDVRSSHRVLHDAPDAELSAIPLLAEGQRLRRYAEYLDLHDPARANFLASGDEVVRPGQDVIARSSVPKEIWEELLDACAEVTGGRRRRSA